MNIRSYFYNCSEDYINKINPQLFAEVTDVLHSLEKRNTQSEINMDILIELSKRGWSFDSAPASLQHLKDSNTRFLCLTSTTLNARWHSDFAKLFDNRLVQVEIQFGTVESMFKDFCGFRIAYYERRLDLGIEVVMCEPNAYFAERKSSVTGMAYFDIAKNTLPSIGLDCPIWLLGLYE